MVGLRHTRVLPHSRSVFSRKRHEAMVGPRSCAARFAEPSFHRFMPPNFMHPPLIKPFFWFSCQAGSHRIFTDILPFLRIAFSAAQTMMESGALKSSSLVAGF